MSIADGGAIAVTLREAPAASGFCANETLLFAADEEELSFDARLLANSPGAGAWLDSGAWLSVGWHIDEYPYIAGSPVTSAGSDGDAQTNDIQAEYETRMLYYVTEPVAGGTAPDPEDPDEPDDPSDPEDPSDPDDPDGPADPGTQDDGDDPDADGGSSDEGIKPLVSTGDGAAPFAASAALIALASTAALATAARFKS